MPRKPKITIAPEILDQARQDAIQCAVEVMTANGWRKAPAQSLVMPGLIKGCSTQEAIKIMECWCAAYQRKCFQLSNDDLIERGLGELVA